MSEIVFWLVVVNFDLEYYGIGGIHCQKLYKWQLIWLLSLTLTFFVGKLFDQTSCNALRCRMVELSYLDSGIISVKISAKDTLADLKVFTQARVDDLRGADSIWDFNQLNTDDLDTSSVNSYITKTVPLNNPRKGDKAAHFAKSDLVFGLLRMYQQLRTESGVVIVDVFRTEEEALSWISES